MRLVLLPVLLAAAAIAPALAQQSAVDGQPTVLFLDEVHRFNKSQQDTFLPYVEDGTLIFVGATTENPFFALIAPLLSPSSLFRFEPLAESGRWPAGTIGTVVEADQDRVLVEIGDDRGHGGESEGSDG